MRSKKEDAAQVDWNSLWNSAAANLWPCGPTVSTLRYLIAGNLTIGYRGIEPDQNGTPMILKNGEEQVKYWPYQEIPPHRCRANILWERLPELWED